MLLQYLAQLMTIKNNLFIGILKGGKIHLKNFVT